jgi:hypothetical protein
MSIYRCYISDYDLKVAKFQNVKMKRSKRFFIMSKPHPIDYDKSSA